MTSTTHHPSRRHSGNRSKWARAIGGRRLSERERMRHSGAALPLEERRVHIPGWSNVIWQIAGVA